MSDQIGTPRRFRYTAIDADGERQSDVVMARSEPEVRQMLAATGQQIIGIKQVSGIGNGASFSEILKGDLGSGEPKMKVSELAAFVRQLHQMLKSGISVADSIHAIGADHPKSEVADMLTTVSERINSGIPLSQAFEPFPKAFPDVFQAYMAAGEQSGDLVEVTRRLSAILDKRAEIQRKVKSVSMYPMLVTGAIFGMLALIILMIVPRYTEIYEGFDAELPAPTRAVVWLSSVFPVFTIVLGAVIFGWVTYNRSQKDNVEFGEKVDRVKFRVPIFGILLKKLTLFRFASTAGGAMASGVQSHESLSLAGQAAASRWVQATIPTLQDAIQSGRPLSTGLGEFDDLYPGQLLKMVAVGEQSGDLPDMLVSAAAALEDEVDLVISTMSAKIEVAMLMFMGISVGGILMALYLPILQLATTAGDKYGF